MAFFISESFFSSVSALRLDLNLRSCPKWNTSDPILFGWRSSVSAFPSVYRGPVSEALSGHLPLWVSTPNASTSHKSLLSVQEAVAWPASSFGNPSIHR